MARSQDWKAVKGRGTTIDGDALKRVPAGYDPAHPFAEDLRVKDFHIMSEFTERQVCARDFMDRYLEACRAAAPLMQFLTKALNLPWWARWSLGPAAELIGER